MPQPWLRPWVLGVCMALSMALVAGVSVWDETREATEALSDMAQDASMLADVTGAQLQVQLAALRHDAMVHAVGVPWCGTAGCARVHATTDEGGGLDVMVPVTQLLRGNPWLVRGDGRTLLRWPGTVAFRDLDGRVEPLGSIGDAYNAGRTAMVLSRPQAAALGLPRRMAVAGITRVDVPGMGRWGVAVVASARRARDRQSRARWRLVFSVVLAGVLVSAFGGLALRTRRTELMLEQALTLASLREARDAQLARERHAAVIVTLAAGVAHEVTTPLSVIVGRAEQVLNRGPDDERDRRALDAIVAQAGRIREVVRGFLRLARGDVPEMSETDPAAVVAAAAALVGHRFAAAGVRLRVAVNPGNALVRCAPRLLEHALVNLLLNACDACGRDGEVTVGVAQDPGHVCFTVVDDGSGIRPEDAARVVEPFFSTKATDQGTGLGLAITTEIARIHRGELTLVPVQPHGTRATVRVPCSPGDSHDP